MASIYVNGQRSFNPYKQLYQGDVVFVNDFKIDLGTSQLNLRSCVLTDKTLKLGLHPRTCVYTHLQDTPTFVEVDELTSSFLVLVEPQR